MTTLDRTAPRRPQDIHRVRLRAGWISAAVSVAVLAAKLLAYFQTGSAAVFSDAMESIVNVVAAAVLVFSLIVAARPADRDHPYGHGKVEFFSAGIEGTMIVVAAVAIFVQAVEAALAGRPPHQLGAGMAWLAAASGCNGALAAYLVRIGRQTDSFALVADGRHLLADVWTSAGVIAGLGVVAATGYSLLDPVIAGAVAIHVLRGGLRLLGDSIKGLMDAADEDLLERIGRALTTDRPPEWIDIHGLRARKSGGYVHTDMHVLVPRYFDAERLHEIHDEIAARVRAVTTLDGETVVHFDPCTPSDCRRCELEGCPVRAAAFERAER